MGVNRVDHDTGVNGATMDGTLLGVCHGPPLGPGVPYTLQENPLCRGDIRHARSTRSRLLDVSGRQLRSVKRRRPSPTHGPSDQQRPGTLAPRPSRHDDVWATVDAALEA